MLAVVWGLGAVLVVSCAVLVGLAGWSRRNPVHFDRDSIANRTPHYVVGFVAMLVAAGSSAALAGAVIVWVLSKLSEVYR
jgi:hypothetical protein